MMIQRTGLALLSLSVGLLCAAPARAVVLASDDFENPAPGGGFGWAEDQWSGNGGVGNGVINFGDIGRHFATPIDPFALGKVYISMEYAQIGISPGMELGSLWGGVTIYESDNAESLFIGNPWGAGDNGLGDYGVATGAGNVPDNILHSGVDFDTALHKFVTEVDTTTAGEITYRFWFDSNTILSAPTATLSVPAADSPINASWSHVYFRADVDNTGNQGDSLVIATTAAEVGLTSDAVVTVDRSTGTVTLEGAAPVSNVVEYSLTSNAGSLVQSNWTTIAGNYDGSPTGDGSFDDGEWTVETLPGATTDLTETTLGDGGALTSTPIDLGTPWFRSHFEDVEATIVVDNGGSLETINALVNYTGTGPELGDLNGDGNIDSTDWAAFRSGQGLVSPAMTVVQAYQMGDIDGDFDHDLLDFGQFRSAFDMANGLGAFAAMVSAAPEPTSLALMGCLSAACVATLRLRRGLTVLALLGAVAFSASQVEATVFVEDNFSAADSGTGWAAGSQWNNLSGGAADTAAGNWSFRNLDPEFEPFNSDKIYIAFDFQASHGDAWGGVAFFDDDNSSGQGYGAETLFIGDVSTYNAYSVGLNQGGVLPEVDEGGPIDGIPVDQDWRRLVLEIDFDDDATEPFEDTYSLWVDNYDVNSPNSTITIDDSPILNGWKSIRIASDTGAGETVKVDNFLITDEASKAFAPPLEIVVDKSTGDVTLQNGGTSDVGLSAYTIESGSGALSVGGSDGDYNSDSVVDAADYTVWRDSVGAPAGTLPNDPNASVIGPEQYATWQDNYGAAGGGEGGWDSLEDQDLAGFPAGDGTGDGWEEGDNPSSQELTEYYLQGESMLSSSESVSLGLAYGAGATGAEDLVFSYYSDGDLQRGIVSYVSSSLASTSAVPEPTSAGLVLLGAVVALAVSGVNRLR